MKTSAQFLRALGGSCFPLLAASLAGQPADLRVSQSATPDPAPWLSEITYSITVSNAGPGAATDVRLTDTLPAAAEFVSLSSGGGAGFHTNGVVTGIFDSLVLGEAVTLLIRVSPSHPGVLQNTVAVSALETDPDSTSNSNTLATTVSAPLSGSLSLYFSSARAATGSLALTLTGPANAFYAVEESGDLVSWSNVTNLFATAGQATFARPLDSRSPTQHLFRAAATILTLPRDDAAAIQHDDTLQVLPPGVLANDSVRPGQPVAAELVTGPAHGALTLNADGGYRYSPAADFVGSDSFVYRIAGTPTNSAVATVSIGVTNQPPTAMADAFGVHSNLNLEVPAPGVLRNDLSGDGDALTASLITNAIHGVVTLLGDGSFSYHPFGGYVGGDQFSYSASDGTSQSSAVVTLTIHPGNAPPQSAADSYVVTHDHTLSRGAAVGLLANDADTDGDPLTAGLVSPPAHGSVMVFPDGAFDYFPQTNYLGSDSFTYEARDGITSSAPAMVSIYVSNTVPVGVADSYRLPPNVEWSVEARGVLRNDVDADGDPLAALLVTGPTQGALTFPGDGSFVYTPSTNFAGTDSFTYAAYDAFATSAPVLVSLVVSNHAPVAKTDHFGVHAGRLLQVPPPGVLANDLDGDGDTLTVQEVANTTHGPLTLNANGSFTYSPSDGYSGSDSFSYFVSDGTATSTVVTVTLNIHTANAPPTGVSELFVLRPNEPLLIEAPSGLLRNDQDAEGDLLSVQPVSGCTNGTLTVSSDGSFAYIPATGFAGADSFSYQVFDGVSFSPVIQAGLLVQNQNPIVEDDFFEMHAGTVLTVLQPGVLGNDGDADYDLPTAVLTAPPVVGNLQFTNDGSFSFVAPTGFVGVVTFSYRAFDEVAYSPTGIVQILVTDETPVANDDHYAVQLNGSLAPASAGVLTNDFDPDGDQLQAILLSLPTHAAAFSLATDGKITYTPTPGFLGPDAFTYWAFDGVTSSEPATVVITVTDRPIGADDFYVYSHSDVLIVPASSGVLGNDFHDATRVPTATLAQPPDFGSVNLHSDGSFEYTPDPLHQGGVTFSYNVSLGGVGAALPVLVVMADVPPKLTIERMSFVNGPDLIRDIPGPENRPFPFTLPHWRDKNHDGVIDPKQGEHQYGHIFQRNTKMKVTANLFTPDPTPFKAKKITVRGTLKNKGVALNITVEANGTLNEKDKQVWIQDVEAGSAFEDKVNCYDPLEIEWEYKLGDLAWSPAGTSRNRVYLTFAKPGTVSLYETVLDYGSRGAKGKDKKEEVRDKIWENFSGRKAARLDGKPLGYYRDLNTISANTMQLLASLDGQCTSWADFLDKCFDAQGLGIGKVLSIRPTDNGLFFIVKDWTFPAQPPFVNVSSYPQPPKFGQSYPDMDGPNQRYLFTTETVSDRAGLPGQNSTNPSSMFNNHIVVKVGSEYYDPSYGVIHKGLMDVQDGALDGFYTPEIKTGTTTFEFEHKKRPKDKKEQLRLKEK